MSDDIFVRRVVAVAMRTPSGRRQVNLDVTGNPLFANVKHRSAKVRPRAKVPIAGMDNPHRAA
jgi:hypothetical protein